MSEAMAPPSAFDFHGLTLGGGVKTWRAHCLNARLIAGTRWVEMLLSGRPSYKVVLKICPHADVHDARHAIEWWLLTPGREDGDVIEVA